MSVASAHDQRAGWTGATVLLTPMMEMAGPWGKQTKQNPDYEPGLGAGSKKEERKNKGICGSPGESTPSLEQRSFLNPAMCL